MRNKIESYEGFNLTFHVTEDCPLRCLYCYQAHRKVRDLSFDNAKKFIDRILEDPDPINVIGTEHEWILNQGLVLDFIGGDALTRVEFVEKIIKYFVFKSNAVNSKWRDRWRISISTNGVLFGDPKVREFCKRYKDVMSLGVSIDGCPEIHDKNRVFPDGSGSMNAIIKGWEFYKSVSPGELQTKATLNKESIPTIAESVKWMYETLGITQIFMNFIFEDMKLEPTDLEELDRQLSMCVDYLLEKKDELYFSLLDESLALSGPMKEPKKGWCGAGSMPAVSVDGKIYPCFRFVPDTISEEALADGADMSVGDVDSGFTRKENFEKIRACTRDVISPEKCKQCDIESTCSWCIGGAFAEEGKLYRQTNICETHKLIVKWAREYWKRYRS